jgi:hypothetical protein
MHFTEANAAITEISRASRIAMLADMTREELDSVGGAEEDA